MSWHDDRWRDSYDAWKLRSPYEDDPTEPEPEDEDQEDEGDQQNWHVQEYYNHLF